MIDDPQMMEEPTPPEATAPGEKVIDRDEPEVSDRRRALVKSFTSMVTQAKKHWEPTFKKMERDQLFCAGRQWPEETKADLFNDAYDDRYVANITLRHVQQRVAALYAKNPKAVARRRQKLLSTVWDGNPQSLMQAQQTMQSGMMAQQAMEQMAMGGPPPMDPMTGAPQMLPPVDPVAMQEAQMVIQDAQNVKMQLDQLNKIARTLELLYEYEVSEQQQPFKSMMKMVIRRAATSGVGWVRVGFQRIMGKDPNYDSRIADMELRLSTIERISADLADGETQPDSAEAEQLRLAIQDLQNEQEIVVREGLMFSYPKPTAIIPDPRCVQLRDFLGCDWVAEEFIMSPNEIKEVYGVDVGKKFNAYDRIDTATDYERARGQWLAPSSREDDAISEGDASSALVWEIYNKRDGMVYVVCDGYSDFLREPASPEFYTDRFWPWYLVAFNECDGKVYPPSDIQLIRPMQLELNRARQAQREHRFANRPKMAYAEGLLSQEDLDALKTHPVNALIAISGLQPGQNIEQVLQPLKGSPLDPNLYEVNPVFQDFLRVSGDQEANLGGTANATATETQVAQSSRATAMGSAIDDIDETLTGIARASGQILLLNVSEETVREIVGPGAVWPTLTKAEVAKDLFLEIEAGSSGRPNQAMEVQNFERLAPILMQLPGVTPKFLAEEAIKRMDDKIDIEAALSEGLPSITSMNNARPMPPGGAPGAQGAQGANNAEKPPGPNSRSPGANSGAPDQASAPGPMG